MTTHDERVAAVAKAIADSENGEGYWDHINEWSGDWLEEKHNHQEVERITAMARAAVAMDAEPSATLGDVNPAVAWAVIRPTYCNTSLDRIAVYDAFLHTGRMTDAPFAAGTGPTIDAAIRDAVRAAQEADDDDA